MKPKEYSLSLKLLKSWEDCFAYKYKDLSGEGNFNKLDTDLYLLKVWVKGITITQG